MLKLSFWYIRAFVFHRLQLKVQWCVGFWIFRTNIGRSFLLVFYVCIIPYFEAISCDFTAEVTLLLSCIVFTGMYVCSIVIFIPRLFLVGIVKSVRKIFNEVSADVLFSDILLWQFGSFVSLGRGNGCASKTALVTWLNCFLLFFSNGIFFFLSQGKCEEFLHCSVALPLQRWCYFPWIRLRLYLSPPTQTLTREVSLDFMQNLWSWLSTLFS